MATKRYRDWTFIIYPESLPIDWIEIIESWHVQCTISPLHDKDVNPDGEIKKSHRHVVLSFEGVQSYEAVKELIEPLHGTIPQVCKSKRGSIRYFVHLDNPEKYQYDKGDIMVLNGFDIDPYFEYTISEQKFIIGEMQDWCDDNEIWEIGYLMRYAKVHRYDDWYQVLTQYKGVTILKIYCDSIRHSKGLN